MCLPFVLLYNIYIVGTDPVKMMVRNEYSLTRKDPGIYYRKLYISTAGAK